MVGLVSGCTLGVVMTVVVRLEGEDVAMALVEMLTWKLFLFLLSLWTSCSGNGGFVHPVN